MTPQEARIKERIGLVKAINDLHAEIHAIKGDAWAECSAAHARWASDMWDWEHGYIGQKPEKPTNPYK